MVLVSDLIDLGVIFFFFLSYNEYENTDYGRRVEHYDRRDSRALEGGSRYDERKEREMMRREMGSYRDIRVRDDRRAEDRSRTDEKLNR